MWFVCGLYVEAHLHINTQQLTYMRENDLYVAYMYDFYGNFLGEIMIIIDTILYLYSLKQVE